MKVSLLRRPQRSEATRFWARLSHRVVIAWIHVCLGIQADVKSSIFTLREYDQDD